MPQSVHSNGFWGCLSIPQLNITQVATSHLEVNICCTSQHTCPAQTSACKQALVGQRVKQAGCPWRCDYRAVTQLTNTTWNPCRMHTSSYAGVVIHPPRRLIAHVALLTGLNRLVVYSSVKGIPKQVDRGCTITRKAGSMMRCPGPQPADKVYVASVKQRIQGATARVKQAMGKWVQVVVCALASATRQAGGGCCAVSMREPKVLP